MARNVILVEARIRLVLGSTAKFGKLYFLLRIKEGIMLELIKKALMTGVGMAAMTKEKIEELAHDIAKKSKLSEKEGKKLIDDLLERSQTAKKDLESFIEKTVKKVMKSLNIATREDTTKLARRIKKLEDRIRPKQDQDA
jgi:polyhydroxyalkanoate synthesis regulator phasin